MIRANVTYLGEKKYKALFDASVADMVTVLNHPRFMAIFAEELNDSRDAKGVLKGELSAWKDKSAQEIFNRLFINGELRLIIHTYYTAKRVIGYGVHSNDNIYVNTKYLASYTVDDPEDRKQVGSNLGHEEYHNRGMDHDFKATTRRKHSVCYIFNDAYKRAHDELIQGGVSPEPSAPVYRKKPWWKIW
jgi:hypothetical protein